MRARRINVHILAQQVDMDGTPLGTDGEAFGRKWRSNVEWVRRPLSVNGFCPKTVDVGYPIRAS